MKLLFCYGTRPEYIKIKPLLTLSDSGIQIKSAWITQHEDTITEHNPDYVIRLEKESENRLNSIFASVIKKFESIPHKDFDYVLVQGDTASAAAIALVCFNSKIKVIHLEAGLRTYDKNHPYPEEVYRQIISRISDINLCPTNNNRKNLKSERVKGISKTVGNTCLDNIKNTKTTYGNTVLVTLHRRENHFQIKEFFKEISTLAEENKDLQFILPIHPNPNVLAHRSSISSLIKVIDPLPHSELIGILKDVRFCITDSGGIQEEASFLKKKCIVCRKKTERSEGVGSFFILCKSPEELGKIFKKMVKNFRINKKCPFGDGESSKKILKLLKNSSKYGDV